MGDKKNLEVTRGTFTREAAQETSLSAEARTTVALTGGKENEKGTLRGSVARMISLRGLVLKRRCRAAEDRTTKGAAVETTEEDSEIEAIAIKEVMMIIVTAEEASETEEEIVEVEEADLWAITLGLKYQVQSQVSQ